MVKGISGYLGRSGSIGILVNLRSDSKRFNELKDLTGVSPSTLSDRLEEGRELGVITTRLGQDEFERDQRAVHHEYMITDRGLVVLHEMQEEDVVYSYRQLREAEISLNEGLEHMHDWIVENTERLKQAKEKHPSLDAFGEVPNDSFESTKDYSEFMVRGEPGADEDDEDDEDDTSE